MVLAIPVLVEINCPGQAWRSRADNPPRRNLLILTSAVGIPIDVLLLSHSFEEGCAALRFTYVLKQQAVEEALVITCPDEEKVLGCRQPA